MSFWKTTARRLTVTFGLAGYLAFAGIGARAAELAIPDVPLFLSPSATPLNMLVMGRDHKLYYEAYNDASDLNADGELDVGYRPDVIDYFGYFDSYVCYTYDAGLGRFRPSTLNPSSGGSRTKKCSGAWSGDFLNYLTTSRIDAIRKVLYGGSRFDDPATGRVVLQRSHIPQDAHSWGKEYESPAVDGYDLRDYSPLSLPNPGRRHLFANTTVQGDALQLPRLRYLLNRQQRIWEWVSIERMVSGTDVVQPGTANRVGVTPTDLTVRVEVCAAGLISDAEALNCRAYPNGSSKPIGLLQRYGEANRMSFGLMTGSYDRNTDGGVLRKNVGTITDEINATTGQFTATVGVIRTIDLLQTVGFSGTYSCGWIATRAINPGECRMWGNPVGEMMYETVRYFADRGSPTAQFISTLTGAETDTGVGLPKPAWQRPYDTNQKCAKPFMTVISDINPSYDSDAVPGSPWSSTTNTLPVTFSAATELQTIATHEPGIVGSRFIGQVTAADTDGAPMPRNITAGNFAGARGLAPEEPTKQGSYTAAAVAYFANRTDVNPGVAGEQKPATFAVALASPLPRIEIPFGDKTVTLVPFAKSVGGSVSGQNLNTSVFKPTNQIVDFYYDRALSNPPDRYFFRVNFEDVEQGADHDMDAIVTYDVRRTGPDTLEVTLNSTYAAGSITQHLGYVISGTQRDGIYLEVRDVDTSCGGGGNCPGGDIRNALDTPAGRWFGDLPAAAPPAGTQALPLTATRTFTVGSSSGAQLLRDPLWYAAKWGGFIENPNESNDLPDRDEEWTTDPTRPGEPDNYFLVTNALNLGAQLSSAFDAIERRNTSATSVALNSSSLQENTRIFQARFDSLAWTGQLLSFKIDETGNVLTDDADNWDGAEGIPAPATRVVITATGAGTGVPFEWASLDAQQQAALKTSPTDTLGPDRVAYLRGVRTGETGSPSQFRKRERLLGDIVSSSPAYVGNPRRFYRDNLDAEPYSEFKRDYEDRTPVVYTGANDGMLHAFDARGKSEGGGQELLAFIPNSVFPKLRSLTENTYQHRFFVDGSPTTADAFVGTRWRTMLVAGLNAGGQAVYSLDITDPDAFSQPNADDIFMWEFTDRGAKGDPELGLTYSRPLIVRLNNGKWAAVFGNGHNNTTMDGSASVTGNAVLYVVDLASGTLIRKITTGVGMAQDPTGLARPNALSSPNAIDVDGDQTFDIVYAGDLYGNLWKFDLRSTNAATWDVAYTSGTTKLPLFTARNASGDPQPITSRPSIAFGPNGVGYVVLFGTGKYLELTDRNPANLEVMSFYGLYDRNTMTTADRITARSSLLQQTITSESSETINGVVTRLRETSTGTVGALQRGWYVDLQRAGGPFEGEMQVSDSLVRGGRIVFTTLIPNADTCAFGGSSWLMALDPLTGSAPEKPQFDLDLDGKYTVDDGIVSGYSADQGLLQQPGVLTQNATGEILLYTAGTSEGQPKKSPLRGVPFYTGRQSWRQVR